MESACEMIPDEFSDEHGYHQDCFGASQRILIDLHGSEPGVDCSDESRVDQRRSNDTKTMLFAKDCIFCHKEDSKPKIGWDLGQRSQHQNS